MNTTQPFHRIRPLALILALLLIALSPGGAPAQTPDEPLSRLIEQATRDGLRVIVIEAPGGTAATASADTPAAGTGAAMRQAAREAGDMSMLSETQLRMSEFRRNLSQRIRALPSAFGVSIATLQQASPTGSAVYFPWIIFWTMAYLAIGYYFIAYFYGRRFVRSRFVAMQRSDPQGLLEKLPILFIRLAFGVLGTAMTVAIAVILGLVTFGQPPNEAAEKTVLIVTGTFVVLYVVNTIWRLILAPYLTQYRIPRLSDPDARRLFWWLASTSTVAITTHAYCTWMYELGLSHDVHAVVTSGLTLLTVLVSVAAILVNRRAVSAAILNGIAWENATLPLRAVAVLWAPLGILYFGLSWAEMTYRLILRIDLGYPLVLGAYNVVMSMLVVYGLIQYAIERYFHRRRLVQQAGTEAVDDTPSPEPAPAAAASPAPAPDLRSFEDLATRVGGILALYAGAWALTRIWSVPGMAMTESLADILFDAAVILFLGYIVYQAARIAIDNKIVAEGGGEAAAILGDEGGANGASRVATLLPLLRSIVLITISFAVGVLALLQMGINVGPIFAGAGVVGIAIGFGAQYLVRDIFSGAFFLIDDAFRKGEYIDTGTVKGTVEKISIRSFQLRHHLGPLHTIPFGEIHNLTNYSRDWVIMKLPLRVTYDTNVEKVRKLIKTLGVKLQSDPVIGDQFLQPLKSQGVIEMQDSAMIIRVKFMTKPGDQWTIRQRVYAEIRELFEREGIKFAHREVTVRVAGADPEKLTPEQKEAIAGAALEDTILEGRAMAADDR